MPLNIKVNNFEGPFDLLLHLIKKNEMDIYDVKIYEITNQYLQYINVMKEMDLEVTSEFVVIAATLLEIKSRMLLPSQKNETAEENETDPRKELIAKLVEYKKFKAVAKFFREKENDYGTVYTKKPEIIVESKKPDDVNVLQDITMLHLYNLFNELMNRYNSKINRENVIQREIPVDAYKIEDKMVVIREKIDEYYHISFSDIVKSCSSKIEVVVTFLALLELIKLKNVKIVQEDNFSEIYLERIEDHEEI